MKIFWIYLGIILTIACTGCTTFPSEAPNYTPQVTSNLDIQQADIKTQTKAMFGVTAPDSRVGDFRVCHAILTREAMQLITWNSESQLFKKELSLPIQNIQSVSLIHYGTFGHIRQVHMTSEVGVIVLSFTVGENNAAEAIYKALLEAGVPQGNRTQYVRAAGDANMVIPVFIPVR
jgi:hypothetical protein